MCVRVFNGYVYLLALNTEPDENNPEMAVWRHQITNASGNIGGKELYLDWAETGDYAESTPEYITFGPDGIMYVATDHESPIFMLNPDGTSEVIADKVFDPGDVY